MNYEEILARIAAGEDEEAIVKEFTENLNKANAELRAQEEAKVKAAEAAEVELRKNDLADSVARALNEYVIVCGYGDPEIDLTDVRDIVDGLLELVPLFKSMNVHISAPKTRKVGITGKGKPADDVFAEFFKSLGI